MLTLLALIRLYVPIAAVVLLGFGIGKLVRIPGIQRRTEVPLGEQVPAALGKFLFWVGVPVGIVGFLHQADLSGQIFLAPVVGWAAMLLGLFCGSLWLKSKRSNWPRSRQGSFSLATMLGNTGSIGYPVVLLLPQLGPDYFGWALFYDALGTLPGAYGFGVVLASQFGDRPLSGLHARSRWLAHLLEIIRNPTIVAFCIAIALRPVPFPAVLDSFLYRCGWLMVMLSLVLMGLRLHQITSWRSLKPAAIAVGIKMLLIPLVIGLALTLLGVDGPSRLVLVVQAGMPCAFATLILAEAYDLDRELAITCLGLSSTLLMLTLPVWLWGFAP
ncbi:MAG TPA: AEC family transporter [Leptolyngbyaceae cyanobacterium]